MSFSFDANGRPVDAHGQTVTSERVAVTPPWGGPAVPHAMIEAAGRDQGFDINTAPGLEKALRHAQGLIPASQGGVGGLIQHTDHRGQKVGVPYTQADLAAAGGSTIAAQIKALQRANSAPAGTIGLRGDYRP